jgi:DNA-directed RNA polymerase specialized sigma24 family protein
MISDRLNSLAADPHHDPAALWDAARKYARYAVSTFVPTRVVDDVAQDAVLDIIRASARGLPVNGATVYTIARGTAMQFLRDGYRRMRRERSLERVAIEDGDLTEDRVTAITTGSANHSIDDLLERETLEREVARRLNADRTQLTGRDLAIHDTLAAGVPDSAFRREQTPNRTKVWSASSAASLRPGKKLIHACAEGNAAALAILEEWRRPSHPIVTLASDSDAR